jgi:hypothetical protein
MCVSCEGKGMIQLWGFDRKAWEEKPSRLVFTGIHYKPCPKCNSTDSGPERKGEGA